MLAPPEKNTQSGPHADSLQHLARKGPPMKYLLAGFLPLLLAASAHAQENEAEKLFRAMEKKVRTAKAFDVSCSYEINKSKSKADLLLTQDNKARLKVIGRASFDVISDGKQSKSN